MTRSFKRRVEAKVDVPVATGHLDEFLRSRCAPDVLPFFRDCHKAAKEVTESMAALRWARKALGVGSSQRRDVRCLVPGDGVLPRTGALVAHKTRWVVTSVDPLMRVDDPRLKKVDRLYCLAKRVEEMRAEPMTRSLGLAGAVLAVHSHAPLEASAKLMLAMYDPVVVVAIPCCEPQELSEDLLLGTAVKETIVRDDGIFSDKNEVHIWNIRRL